MIDSRPFIVESIRPLAIELALVDLDPANARRHGAKNKAATRASLTRFGQVLPIVVRRAANGRFLVHAGNCRVEIMREAKWSHAAAVVLEGSSIDATAYGIADNRTAELATWDQAALVALLSDLAKEDGGLDGVGFDEDEVDELQRTLAELAGGDGAGSDADDDEEDEREPPNAPSRISAPQRCAPGDVWRIGSHRLAVGDSTFVSVMRFALGKLEPRAVFTDPPFAVYGSSTGVSQSVADDGMVRPFFRAMLRGIHDVVPPFAHVYVCCDWRSYPAIREEARGVLEAKNLIVWRKKNRSKHAYHYGHRHELISFFVKEPRATSLFQKGTGHRPILDDNTWDAPVVHVSKRWHFAEKPQENVRRAITNSTAEGDVVFDPFGGGASVLVAAQALGRIAVLVEKDVTVADRIILRAKTELGLEAERIEQHVQPDAEPVES